MADPREQFATLSLDGKTAWLAFADMTPRQRKIAQQALYELSGRLDREAAEAPVQKQAAKWKIADDVREKLRRLMVSRPRAGQPRRHEMKVVSVEVAPAG
jgi:hypothetical protein